MLARGGVLASTLAVARGGDADVGRFRPRGVAARSRGFGSAPRSAAGPARRATATRALEGFRRDRLPARRSIGRDALASRRLAFEHLASGWARARGGTAPARGRAPRARRAPAPAPRAMMEPSTYGHAAPSDASSFAAILSSNPFAPGYVRVRPRAGPRAATAEEKPSPSSRRDPRMNVSLLSPSPRSPLAPPAPFAPDPPPPNTNTPTRFTDDRPPSACTPSASSSRPWRSCPPP